MMQPKALMREAWLNVRTGTTKTGLFALLLTAIGATLILADASVVQQLSAAATAYQNAGASTYTVEAEQRINAEACTSLAVLPGVQAAGAIRNPQHDLEPAALPSSTIPYYETTVGFGALLGATESKAAGVLVSDQVSEALGVTAGDEIPLRKSSESASQNAAQVRGVYAYPDDGRMPGFGYAVLAEVTTQQGAVAGGAAGAASSAAQNGLFDQCWVRMWPESPSIRAQLMAAVMPGSAEDTPPALSKLNTRFGEEFSGRAQFADRVTRFVPAAAVLFGAALGFLALRVRRIHLAAALHSGVRRADLTIILGLEQLSWVLLSGALLVNVAAWGAMPVLGEDRPALFALAMLTVSALTLGTFVGAALALMSTRERALFTYFKER